MIWAELVRVRPFGLVRVVIFLWGSGWIAVDRLFLLFIYLSVYGFMLAWMCVSTILCDAQPTSLLSEHTPALTLHPVCVFSYSASLRSEWLQPNQSAVPQSIPLVFTEATFLLLSPLTSIMPGMIFTEEMRLFVKRKISEDVAVCGQMKGC